MKIKIIISILKADHLTLFKYRGTGELESDLFNTKGVHSLYCRKLFNFKAEFPGLNGQKYYF